MTLIGLNYIILFYNSWADLSQYIVSEDVFLLQDLNWIGRCHFFFNSYTEFSQKLS